MGVNMEVLETIKSDIGKDIVVYKFSEITRKVVYGRFTVYVDTHQQYKETIDRFKKLNNF